MKKVLLTIAAALSSLFAGAQCVTSCSNYIAQPVTFSMQSAAGNSLVLQDDELSAPVPIGFTFSFMCSTYTSLIVSSNGFLTFDPGALNNGCCSGQSIPGVNDPNNFVAFTWNDLDPSTGGTITYTTIGVNPNQIFILTYSAVPHCCQPSPVNTGQIKLFQNNGNIEIHSALITNDGSNSTQGIEDQTGTIGVATPGANATTYTTSNTAYRFTNTIPTPPGAIAGPSVVCAGPSFQFSVAPMPGASSYSWTLPMGWTGTSTTNIINGTPGGAGVISVQATYTCGTSSATTKTIGITPGPTVTINASTVSICQGAALTLTASGANTYSWSTGATTGTIAPTPTANTSYSVTGTSTVGGCTGTAAISVTVYPAPSLTVTGPSSVCAGQSLALNASGANAYTWTPTNVTFSTVVVTPTTTTNYTVTGASNGCTSTAVKGVTVTPLPNLITTGAASICNGQSVGITVSGAGSYTWMPGNQTTSMIAVSPTVTTSYTVVGSTNGCTNTAVKTVSVFTCTGIQSMDAETKAAVIYPNPTNGEFTIELKNGLPKQITVFDYAGKLVYTLNTSKDVVQVNFTQFAKGVYMVKLESENQTQTLKLMKE